MDRLEEQATPTPSSSDGVIGTVRLLNSLREHNVTILLSVLVLYQIGLLDKLVTYGSGMC